MPVRPNFLDRLDFFRLNRTPAPLLDVFGAVGVRAASLAVEMGVFEALAAGNRTPEALADAVGADPDGLAHLLAVLAALGYVREQDGGYELTGMTRRWLTGEETLGPWLRFWTDLGFPYWGATLEETVRTGDPPQTLAGRLADSDALERAQKGVRALDTLLVEDVLEAVPVRDSDRDLLAVGGGHARYTIEACRRYPNLDATIVDDPDALALARQDVAATDLDDRIDCTGLDVRSAYLGESYDLAFLVDLAHGVGPVVDSALLGRIYDALEPGGRVSVLGQFGDERPTPASNAAVAVARFLAFSTGAETHATDTVADWLRDAGFDSVDETRFRALPGVGLLVAEKPLRTE